MVQITHYVAFTNTNYLCVPRSGACPSFMLNALFYSLPNFLFQLNRRFGKWIVDEFFQIRFFIISQSSSCLYGFSGQALRTAEKNQDDDDAPLDRLKQLLRPFRHSRHQNLGPRWGQTEQGTLMIGLELR